MGQVYEVAVVGLGVMGSAACQQLAQAGVRVLGLERYWPGHGLGSSGGRTRLLRRAHFEHPDDTPLALRAEELWAAAERAGGRPLFVRTGALVVGPEDGVMVAGTLASARLHDLACRQLGPAELRRDLPMLRCARGEVGVLEEGAGVLRAEACVTTCQELALRAGAELRFGVRVSRVIARPGGGIALDLGGSTLEADRVVVAAGPWTSGLFASGAIPDLEVERVLCLWVEPTAQTSRFDAGAFPVVLWDRPGRPFCLFPQLDGAGVKVAFHGGEPASPDELRREVDAAELREARARLAGVAPMLDGPRTAAAACMYTRTRDGQFAIGFVGDERILLVSACSGRGFKFAPVVGEIVSALIVGGATPHPVHAFRLDRPSLHDEREELP